MPLYMDVHNLDGEVGFEDVGKAHQADLQTQAATTSATCAIGWTANTARSSASSRPQILTLQATVHREAHGLVAEEIYEVQEGS